MYKILDYFFDFEDDQEFFIIIQWGKKRTIIQEVHTETYYIVDNSYMMELDEMGVIL